MSVSHTMTATSTFSEARARAVMRHVLGDFMTVANAGHIAHETIRTWCEELEYAVVHEVVERFQLQLTRPDGKRAALEYVVRDDGTVQETSKAGGVDLYEFPAGTKPRLCVSYRLGAPNREKVFAYLRGRGWTTGGSMVEGEPSRDRAYSKDGYGITRSRVGDWK